MSIRDVAVGPRRLRYVEAPARFGEAGPAAPKGTRARGTLVLLHAFPLNARMWEPQLALAERGWRILAPELRGFDEGAADPPAATIDDYAADVIDLLDALRIDEAVIGGLSLGGYLTFALFRLAPRYFRAMILADTRPQADAPEAREGRLRTLQLAREGGSAAVVDDVLPRLVSEATVRRHPEIVASIRNLGLANAPGALEDAVTVLMSRPDSTALLTSIHCPTLIIVGRDDAITPPAVSEALNRAIAGSRLVVIDEAGHLSNLEQPAAFNRALADFLEHRV
jgi:3-oxoadipate enol-lactonase